VGVEQISWPLLRRGERATPDAAPGDPRARRIVLGVTDEQRAGVVEESLRVLGAASHVTLRLIGGVAIRLRCPSALAPPLARECRDLDFCGRSEDSNALIDLLTELGYESVRRFNALHGHRRLLFKGEAGRDVDILLDRFEMCHRLDLRQRLHLDEQTLPLADLLLTKLQIVEANPKDITDAAAIVVDHPVDTTPGVIDASYIAGLCSQDWGLNRTVDLSLARLREALPTLGLPEESVERGQRSVDELAEAIERAPKTLRWKARARVGERVRWYELPEEVG
jgi:hypothetical protein